MAHAPIVLDKTARRTAKALTIVARQECELLDDGRWMVRDTQTGSGTPHIVVNGHCDCQDHTRRAAYCKHLQAVALEERDLKASCNDWNARSEQTRVALEDMPGDFLSTDLNFDDGSLTAEDRDWLSDDVNRDRATSTYAADGWAHQSRCPMCGSPLTTRQYHVGGAGFCFFEVCSGDGSHPARRLS